MNSRNLLTLVLAAWTGFAAAPALAQGEVNLYSLRQPALLEPLTRAFTQRTGIKVNVVYTQDGVLERIKAEGANTAADAVLTVDVGRLHELAEAGVLDPVTSAILESAVPAPYRHPDGLWFALTSHARVIYISKERVKPGAITSYEDLTKPEWKGRICTRSGKNDYNVALIASVIARKGEAGAEQWLTGVKNNLVRKPQGSDRNQAEGIYQGVCDIALMNSYYMGVMATNEQNPEQKKWAAATQIVFPNQDSYGAHINVSGGGVIKGAKNRDNAIRLLEFLVSDEAQKIYAEKNMEYPIKPGAPVDPMVAAWGDFKPDPLSLLEIAKLRAAATRLVDKVGYEQGNGS